MFFMYVLCYVLMKFKYELKVEIKKKSSLSLIR